MNKIFRGLLSRIICIALVFSILLSFSNIAYANSPSNNEFATLRTKWLNVLTGGANIDALDPVIASKITAINQKAEQLRQSMNKSASRTYLWGDKASGVTNPEHIYASYERLEEMALAYATVGGTLFRDASLSNDIKSALTWLSRDWFSGARSRYGNMWFWYIGIPLKLSNVLSLMYDELTATQIQNAVNTINRYTNDLSLPTLNSTGANRSDILTFKLVCAIVTDDASEVANVKRLITPLFRYVTSGDGMYNDGSYILHNDIAYTGTYGQVLLSGVANLLYLLEGSSWTITDSNRNNAYNWVYDAYLPVLVKGATMDMVRGRAIARSTQSDHVDGNRLIGSIAKFAAGSPSPHKENYERAIKLLAIQETYTNIGENISLFELSRINGILLDTSIPTADELVGHYEMPNMGRTIHRVEDYVFGISRSSKRIQNYEYMNGENKRGWTTGDGMTYLYNNDLGQFAGAFWPTVDHSRLPGITVEKRTRRTGYGQGRPRNGWSGGAEMGNYGIAGQSLMPVGSSLRGYKSWFMFDDEIVCLGSNIRSTDSFTIESIVENRKIKEDGTNALTINNVARPTNLGWSANYANVNWAHLEGNVAGSDIGYYFPEGQAVSFLRERRTKSWNDVNGGASRSPISANYLTMYFNHGVNPTGDKYSYVLLPNKTASEVGAYAAQPQIEIVENSTYVHAVKHTGLNITGANFYRDAVQTAGDITSNKMACVILKEIDDNTIEVAVSDPVFRNATITVTINKNFDRVISQDANITVDESSNNVRFTVNTTGAKGKTYKARFAVTSGPATPSEPTQPQATTITPIADTFVYDRNASTNYGTNTQLQIKKSAEIYNRNTYVKFDISQISSATSAKLRVYANDFVASNPSVTECVVRAHGTNTDSWSETTLNWSNSPWANMALGRATFVKNANKYYEFDVTDYIINQLSSGDRLVTFKLVGETPEVLIRLNSRESGVNIPQLVIE